MIEQAGQKLSVVRTTTKHREVSYLYLDYMSMHKIRNTYATLSKAICFLFAVHIFNLSVDPRDIKPACIPEDLTINDIESLVEFFAEEVFDFKNAFAEHDEADDDAGNTVDFNKIYFCLHDSGRMPQRNVTPAAKEYFIDAVRGLSFQTIEISSPPPRI